MTAKRKYKPRNFAPLPDSFFRVRGVAGDELRRRINELCITQKQASFQIGITEPRMSLLLSKEYTRASDDRELVQVWALLEALMGLGANLTVSVAKYSSPGKGSIKLEFNHE